MSFDKGNAAVETAMQKALASSAAKKQKALLKAQEEARKSVERTRLFNAFKVSCVINAVAARVLTLV